MLFCPEILHLLIRKLYEVFVHPVILLIHIVVYGSPVNRHLRPRRHVWLSSHRPALQSAVDLMEHHLRRFALYFKEDTVILRHKAAARLMEHGCLQMLLKQKLPAGYFVALSGVGGVFLQTDRHI